MWISFMTDFPKLWQMALNEIELQVSRAVFKTIFAQTSLVELDDVKAVVGCANPLLINIISKRHYSLIKNTLDTLSKKNLTLSFVAKPIFSQKPLTGPLFNQIKNETTIFEIKKGAGLNPNLTFENFAVSSSNQMAYAATQAVSNSPGSSYNPLFLYGGVGVGKTHLMQAVGNTLLEKKAKMKVIFTMGEEFTNEIIEAIRNKTTDIFKKKYRRANLLLLDDIQFIAGKNTVQEEFFYTFNAIHQSGGQIVMTSDKPPHEIARLENRLRSRFEGGLIIDISPPDFELRTAILLIKAKQRNVDISIEVAKLIASNIEDTRKLEGTLIRLITESETKKMAIDEMMVRNILGRTKVEENNKKTSPSTALNTVASYYNLKISQIRSERRDKPLALSRQILYYILRIELGMPLVDIGSFLGGRDHTTILHGVRKISQLITSDEKIRGDILGIKERLVD